MAGKINWLEYIRDGADYRIVSECADGFFLALPKYFKVRLKKLLTYFKGYILFWYYDQKDIYGMGEAIVKKLLNKNFKTKILNLFAKKTEMLLQYLKDNSMDDADNFYEVYKKFCPLL